MDIEQLKKSFDLFMRFIFGKDLELNFEIEKHRLIKNGYVILLPRKDKSLNHIIGRGGQTLSALNRIFGVWGYRNNVFVVIKQKRDGGETQDATNEGQAQVG